MKDCLLCSIPIRQLTWGGLVGRSGDCICDDCRSGFERIDSQPSRSYFQETIYEKSLDTIHCIYSYNDSMKSFFHHYKFLEDAALAEVFRNEFLKLRPAVPIPIAPNFDHLKRSFAPVEALLPAANVLSILEKNTQVKQSTRKRGERVTSTNPFSIRSHVEVPEEVWLVDDIYTTGTTLHQAAYVLKEAGVKKVHGFCLAETLLKK
ncbi:ComF family protein [Chryseomicrobium palamuruense]|uniref:ComF family protein n=1 Tax=Chryseomicrobium palamuruense TaxID=682973 RepID=A0ABV8UQL4_9BACL